MSEVVSFFLVRRCRARHRDGFGLRMVGVSFLIMMLIAGWSHPLQAQRNSWNLIFTFDRPIGCGYFFDENHGLLGSGIRLMTDQPCAIYKTTDGGLTFTPSVVPTSISGAVTSISMIDSLNGFASIFSSISYPNQGTFGQSALWQTTDGGSTWFDPFHLDHVLSSVYAQNGLILITTWDATEALPYKPPDSAGADYSFDGGATWIENTAFQRCDGIAFSDSLNGVMTEMNYAPGGNNFWVTTDAGHTWQPTVSDLYEAWSVYAMRGHGIYFCANESQPTLGLPYRSINWSTDGGFTWRPRINFSTMHFTGTIEGVGNTLYFQTDTAIYAGDPTNYELGMYRSDDTGAKWHFIGGPSDSRDTRFVVTGCMGQVVYAFDQVGGVYKTTDGGDGTLTGSFTLSADTIQWSPNPCGDTVAFYAIGANCIPFSVDSVSILSGTEFLRLPNDGSLPQTLTSGDSAQILLLYSPTTGGNTTSLVKVYGHDSEHTVTHEVVINTYNSLPNNNLFVSKDTFAMNAIACGDAIDTIYLANLGCSGMILDSVTLPSGEVSVSTLLPASVSNNDSFPLGMTYFPDSAGDHTLLAKVYAHVGRRAYDTTITILARSAPVPEQLIVDSTQLTLAAKYCQSMLSNINLLAFGCDSIAFDSVLSSNGNFVLLHTPSGLAPEIGDSLSIEYAPDSAGTASDTVQIFAHGKWGLCDTTIVVSGSNFSLPQSATLSQNAITLATTSCLALSDTLALGNLGCGVLYLDSVELGDDSEISISYDSAGLPLQSGNVLPIHIAYSPNNGTPKSLTLRLAMHTAQRVFDTTISVNVSNIIPAEPLVLSTDSLYLFTKYCQPITLPLAIGNLGCSPMSLDAITISDDTLNEFKIPGLADSIYPGQWDSTSVTFTPDSAGSREVFVKIQLHNSEQTFDTTLSIIGKNLIAPTPYIPALPTLAAGQVLEIPIMLEPTTDTFSIHSYAFHLSFNTDLLTPTGLVFANTISAQVLSSKLTPEPGVGCSGTVTLIDTISDSSQLSLPLVFVTANVSLTLDTTTQVTLDSFATNAEPTLGLCSIPESPFTLAQACGDPYLLDLLGEQTISFSFVGVSPNPASAGNWGVDYIMNVEMPTLTLDIFDATGMRISHTADLPTTVGEHHASIPIPSASGDYFLVLGNDREQTARKGSVAK